MKCPKHHFCRFVVVVVVDSTIIIIKNEGQDNNSIYYMICRLIKQYQWHLEKVELLIMSEFKGMQCWEKGIVMG